MAITHLVTCVALTACITLLPMQAITFLKQTSTGFAALSEQETTKNHIHYLINEIKRIGHNKTVLDASWKTTQKPLMAIVSGMAEYSPVVQTLIDHGASYSAAFEGQMPLHRATHSGALATMTLLLRAAQMHDREYFLPLYVNRTDRTGRTALHYAALRGSITCMQLLVDNGADVNASDKQCNIPLHLLLSSKASQAVDTKNWYCQQARAIIYLSDSGANPTLANNLKQTPVDQARADHNPNAGLLYGCAKLFDVQTARLKCMSYLSVLPNELWYDVYQMNIAALLPAQCTNKCVNTK